MTDVASFDPVKAEEILREVVTPETWRDISRKVAREKLEEKLGVAPETFKAVKNEINEIIDKIVEEIADDDASVRTRRQLQALCHLTQQDLSRSRSVRAGARMP
ncbi:hypothetical protein Emag_003804 [Eimeria magna]